jgi:hypothetical protein
VQRSAAGDVVEAAVSGVIAGDQSRRFEEQSCARLESSSAQSRDRRQHGPRHRFVASRSRHVHNCPPTAPDTWRRGALRRAHNREHSKDGEKALSINPQDREGEARPDPPTRELAAAPAPTRELPVVSAAGSGDKCSNCGATLAHDQRYCVHCGERRGQSTLPKAEPVTEVRSTRTRSSAARRTPRLSSGATLVSFVGVLLLAVGLGVLIGHSGKNTPTPKAAAAPQVITVQSSGGSGVATAATTATTPASGSTSSANGVHASKKTVAKEKAALASKTVQKKAVQAAGKVLGNGNNLAPPTVKTGGSCTSGEAGCQGGKFTGNFFGGG